jgi:hypothetical protein
MSKIVSSAAAIALLAALTGCVGPGAVQPKGGPSYASLEQDGVMVLAATDVGPAFDAAQSLALGEAFRNALAEQRPGIAFQGPSTLAAYTSDVELQQTIARLLRQQTLTDADLLVLQKSGIGAGYLMTARVVEDRVSTRSRQATEEASTPNFSYYEEEKKVHTMGELDYLYVRYLQSRRSGVVEVALYALKNKELAWSARLDVKQVNEARQELSRMPPPPQGPRGFTGPARFYAAEQLIASTLNDASPRAMPQPKDYPAPPPVSDLIKQAGIDAGKALPKAACSEAPLKECLGQ